jgi:hypothetical protein
MLRPLAVLLLVSSGFGACGAYAQATKPVPPPVKPPLTAPGATAIFDRIRQTPAEVKLYCEMVKLQGDSINAQMRQDTAAVSRNGKRIEEIQTKLNAYKEATAFVSRQASAGGLEYFKTPEGKALNDAQRKLNMACPKTR